MSELLFAPAFTAWGTPLTWLEFVACLLSVIMVLCNQRQWIAGWPLSIAASALYGLLFWRGKLYGQAGLQLFFIVLAAWGWWQWWRGAQTHSLRVQRLDARGWWLSLAAIALAWLPLGLLLERLTDSPLPYWDALPTAASVVTTVLVARKRLENWLFWIVINSFYVVLFWHQGYWLTLILYAAFIPLAARGWQLWRRDLQSAAA